MGEPFERAVRWLFEPSPVGGVPYLFRGRLQPCYLRGLQQRQLDVARAEVVDESVSDVTNECSSSFTSAGQVASGPSAEINAARLDKRVQERADGDHQLGPLAGYGTATLELGRFRQHVTEFVDCNGQSVSPATLGRGRVAALDRPKNRPVPRDRNRRRKVVPWDPLARYRKVGKFCRAPIPANHRGGNDVCEWCNGQQALQVRHNRVVGLALYCGSTCARRTRPRGRPPPGAEWGG